MHKFCPPVYYNVQWENISKSGVIQIRRRAILKSRCNLSIYVAAWQRMEKYYNTRKKVANILREIHLRNQLIKLFSDVHIMRGTLFFA